MGVEFRNEGVKSNVLGKPMKEPQDVPFEKEGQYLKAITEVTSATFLSITYYYAASRCQSGSWQTIIRP